MSNTTDDESGDVPEGAGDTAAQRLIEGASTHAIFMLDSEGGITTWPEPAQALYGYDPPTVLDRDVHILFADEEGMTAPVDTLLAEAKDSTVETEHWHQRADGTVFWATLTLSPLGNDQFHGYAVISQDTTAKHQYEQMLERQNDRLKEFTDILAHDLRTPLSVISGRLELARESGADEHFDAIESTTDRMERLVDDLLRVAQQGRVVTDPEATDIEQVIETAWEGPGNTVDAATLHYEEIPSVSADADRLCELFENLFRNALDHAGPDVTVRVGPLANGFYIEDDGPGIPEERRAEVFDHGVTTTDDGSGYGLSIVRTIVNAHGWDVIVTDGATGGARFEITGIEFLD